MAAGKKNRRGVEIGAFLSVQQNLKRAGRRSIDGGAAAGQAKRVEVAGATTHAGHDLRDGKRVAHGLVSVKAVGPLNGKFDKKFIGNGGCDIGAFCADRHCLGLHGNGLGYCADFQSRVDADRLRDFNLVFQGRVPLESRGLDRHIPRSDRYLRQREIARAGADRLHEVTSVRIHRGDSGAYDDRP